MPGRNRPIAVGTYNSTSFRIKEEVSSREILFFSNSSCNLNDECKPFTAEVSKDMLQMIMNAVHKEAFSHWSDIWRKYFTDHKDTNLLSEYIYCGDFYEYYTARLGGSLFENKSIFNNFTRKKNILPCSIKKSDSICFKFRENDETILLQFVCS